MAFFKSARDQVKVQTFVTYLERAEQLFDPRDYVLSARYLNLAAQRMEKIKKAEAEYFFSREGWLHVMVLCEGLGKALKQAGLDALAEQCLSIYRRAIKSEDAIEGGGMLSTAAQDPRKMVAALASAAAEGDVEAQMLLADMYADGDMIEKDEQKAAESYAKAAAQGNKEAQFQLGVMYERGRGVPKDKRLEPNSLRELPLSNTPPLNTIWA